MTRKATLTRFVLGLTLMAGTTAAVFAQSTNGAILNGAIQGTVLDPSGALIPRAQVTITNAAGFSRTLKSGATGSFELQHLAPGSYSISINAAGFSPALEAARVASDKVTHENVKLGISVEQEIEVLADDAGKQNDAADTSAGNR
jgi:hypothetical protein